MGTNHIGSNSIFSEALAMILHLILKNVQ